MNDTIKDLSLITTLREYTLQTVFRKLNLIIGDTVLENYNQNECLSSFDLEFGILQIYVEGEELKYKFIPSKELENVLIETLNTKKSPLVDKLEDKIQEKIISTYKDLL